VSNFDDYQVRQVPIQRLVVSSSQRRSPQLNPDDFRLTFASRDLPDGATLADMNITHGCILSVGMFETRTR
jgi:hypothetical protein